MEEVNGNVRDVLQTTLNNSQSLSPKLAGMVRRFKAVTTLLMMRRDAAYADLDTYTKRLHKWVDEFDETMRTSIKVAFSGLLFFLDLQANFLTFNDVSKNTFIGQTMQDHSIKYFLIDVTWPLEKQKQQKPYKYI